MTWLIILVYGNYRKTLETLKPAIDRFMSVEKSGDVTGVMITLKGNGVENGCVDSDGKAYDFISRYFI